MPQHCLRVLVLAVLALPMSASAQPGNTGPGALLRTPAGVTGLALQAPGGGELARIELGPRGLWTAEVEEKPGPGRRFSRISTAGTGGTPRLGPGSFVEVTSQPRSPYPRVSFRLELEAFDSAAWERALGGPRPFYFLSCTVPEADLFYQGGALIPSPKVDPYPLSRPNMSGAWAPGWSYAPAMAAYAVPAVGLWRPAQATFVAYDFSRATLSDRSAKYIASAYEAERSAFHLVFPHARRWTELVYPTCPTVIETQFDLLYSTEFPDRQDPNEFVLKRAFFDLEDMLPEVPAMSDLGWIAEFDAWTTAPGIPRSAFGVDLMHPAQPMGLEGVFVEPGATMIGNNFAVEGVEGAYERGDRAAIDRLHSQIATLVARARHFEVGGDACVAWDHPLDGRFREQWGGDAVRGFHHESTFEIGSALLVVYKHERDANLLPVIDGIFNWSRHYMWTRNGVCDLAWAMFSRTPTAVSENFLLYYHHLFRDDPQRRARAEEALELAVTGLYKTLWVYLSDPDETDDFDPSFLTQAVNDRWWIGQVTWNECGWFVRAMVPIYCETGDPNLRYLLRGILERYHVGQLADAYDYCEDIDIFGEWAAKGTRSGVFDPCHADAIRRWAYPPGPAAARVAMGRGGAIAFCKGTRAVDVDDYAFDPSPGFRFRVVSSLARPFDLVASSPYRDLRGLEVRVNGAPCDAARIEFNAATSGEDVLIRGVSGGDVVAIGAEPAGPALPCPRLRERGASEAWHGTLGGFSMVDLRPAMGAPVDAAWSSTAPWRGLAFGTRWIDGVPFALTDPATREGLGAVADGSVDVGPCDGLFVLVGRPTAETAWPRLHVSTDSGVETAVATEDLVPADVANGWTEHAWEFARVGLPVRAGRATIRVEGGLLFAVTAGADAEPSRRALGRLRELAAGRAKEREAAAAAERAMAFAATRVPTPPPGRAYRAAMLPPHGDLVKYGHLHQEEQEARAVRAAERLGLRVDVLSPVALVSPGALTPERYAVAVYTSGEEYIRTVRERGDGEEALRRYVAGGGVLLCLSAEGTFPFVYPMDRTDGFWETAPGAIDGTGRAVFGSSLGCNVTFAAPFGWETPPDGARLAYRPVEGQRILPNFSTEVPFAASGDRRWRSLSPIGLPEGATLRPAVELRGADAVTYGVAAGCVDLRGGGMVGFIYGKLLDGPLGDVLIAEMMASALASRPPERLASLPAEPRTPGTKSQSFLDPASILRDGGLEERGRWFAMQPMDAWRTYGAHSGAWCAELSVDDASGNAVLLTSAAQSPGIGLEPNARYRASFWAKTVSGEGVVRVNIYGGPGYDFPQQRVEIVSDGEWHRYDVEIVTGAFGKPAPGAVFVAPDVVFPAFRIFAIEHKQRTFVDDVSLVRVR